MSSPRNPGGWGPGPRYDPNTGPPTSTNGAGPTPHYPKMRYEGLGVFDQTRKNIRLPQQGMPGHPGAQPPPKNRGPLLALLAGAGVVALAIGTTVLLVGNDGGGNPSTPPVAQRSSAQPAPSRPGTSESRSENSFESNVPAVIPGWQGVSWDKYGIAYDIPPGWKADVGVDAGFEGKPGEQVSMTATSVFMEGFCPGVKNRDTYRARVGVTTSNELDPARAATDTVQQWARLGYGTGTGAPPNAAVEPARPVTFNDGKIHGQLVTASVTHVPANPCDAPNTRVTAVGIPSDHTTVILIGLADQQVPSAVAPEDLERILTSTRLLRQH